MIVTIVYDRTAYNNAYLRTGWGFACLIEDKGKKILFDTGKTSEETSFNLSRLKPDMRTVDAVVISHHHKDHVGGVDAIVKRNVKPPFYVGSSFPSGPRRILREKGVPVLDVARITKIGERIFAGPEMGYFSPKEVPLSLDTDKGMVVIVACAHPGVVKIIKKIKDIFRKNIYLIMGGFHMEPPFFTALAIRDIIRTKAVKVAPCHCTSSRAIALLREKYRENFITTGAGLRLEF